MIRPSQGTAHTPLTSDSARVPSGLPSPPSGAGPMRFGWPRAASFWNAKIALAAVGILFVLHALYLQVVVDDAYISFHFARHLNQGYGLVWNVGDPPIEGYSNFLWVMLLALTERLGIDYAVAGLGFGLAAGLGTLAYAFAFARRWFAPQSGWSWFLVAWLVAAGPLASWSSARLETTLFTLFGLGSLYHLGSFVRRGAIRDVGLACLQLLLASLTRPEGIGIAATVLWIATVAWPGSAIVAEGAELRRRLIRFWIAFALLVMLPFAVYVLWRMVYFQSLLPNTFYAKTGGGLRHVVRGVRYMTFFARDYLLPFLPLAAVLAVMKMRLPSRTLPDSDPPGAASGAARRAALRLEMLLVAGVIGVFVPYLMLVGGDYMPMYRFLVPILPGIALLVTAFLAALDRGASPSRKRNWAICAAVFLALGLTFHHSTPLERDRFGRPAALEGRDGFSYSLEILSDSTGETKRPFGAYLMFVKWSRLGAQKVEGHLESEFLTFGGSAEAAESQLSAMKLAEAQRVLDGLLSARDGASSRRWINALKDAPDPGHHGGA